MAWSGWSRRCRCPAIVANASSHEIGVVVGGTRPQDHRLGDAALLAQPELGATGEVLHGVGGEELAVEQLARGLLRDGLGAVLAELRRVPVAGRGVRPRAALAVEAVDLVEAGQRGRGAAYAHLADGASHRHRDGGDAGGGVGRRLDLDLRLVDVAGGHLPGLVAEAGGHVSQLGEKRHPAHPASGVVPGTPPGGVLSAGIPGHDPLLAPVVPSLFDPLTLGAVTTQNRVLMAPLTRMRATVPGDVAQRPDGASTTSSGPAPAC